jgi:hypothetical protein
MLRSYRVGWLQKDVVAGLILTAMLVPQGMAYAELAHLPPITGLYTSILCLVGYALRLPSVAAQDPRCPRRRRAVDSRRIRFHLADHGVSLVGSLPRGFPPLTLPHVRLDDTGPLLGRDFGLALPGRSATVLPASCPAALSTWADRLNTAWPHSLTAVMAFFNNDHGAAAPPDAVTLARRLRPSGHAAPTGRWPAKGRSDC